LIQGAANARAPTSHVVPAPWINSTFPRLAVDRSGGPHSGNLYLVYNQGPAPALGFQGADHFIDPDVDVYLQRSTNSGANWSPPKLINEGAPKPGSQTTQTRHPDVSVAPTGRVDIVWQDRRHWYQGPGERNCVHTHLACDDARLGDTYYAFSTDGGTNFSRRRVSDRSHNNDVGYDYRFGTGWAFGPVSVPLGNQQLLVGWMDSREGSFDNDTQDIYLAKVDHDGPAAIPQEIVPSESVGLSSLAYTGGGEGLLAGTFATRNGTRVVIVNESDVPGTLAAGVLARANLSPVLHSPASGLSNGVKAEVAKLNPAGAYVIGSEGSLSDQVVQDLAGAGVPNDQNQIVRLAGTDDAGTARLIAEQMDRRQPAEKAAGSPPAFDAAVIANPASPDASAASVLAAARRLPILYVNAGSVPPATAAALGSSSLDIDRTLVIGGPQWVSDGVVSQLPNPKRLGGADQYATSKAVVAESRERGLADNIAYVADGDSPMDGALLGAAAGRTTGLLLLAPEPLEANARAAAADMGLSGLLDRLILAQGLPIPSNPGGGGGPGSGSAPQTPSLPGAPSGSGSPAQGLRCVTRATVGRNRSVRLCVATNPPTASTSQTIAGRLPGPRYAAAAARRKRNRTRTLGSGRTTIPAGRTRPVVARLSARAARVLRKKRKLKVKATILARGADGRTATVRRTVTLEPAKKKKRKSRRKR